MSETSETSEPDELVATPGAKMIYLIKRRPETSRDELIAHWFKNHMPLVIAGNERQAERGKLHARRYIATLFEPTAEPLSWDGMAQLWWDVALPMPDVPHGTDPTDTFQQKAEPYVPWATTEYVVLDGELPVVPNTLNEPFPATRSGVLKVTYLVSASAGIDHDDLFSHWREVHAPRVRALMRDAGGLRYVLSQSQRPAEEPYVGLAELYFPDDQAFTSFRAALAEDTSTVYRDDAGSRLEMTELRSYTQMVGIPG